MDVFLCLGFFIYLVNSVSAQKNVLDYTNCVSGNHTVFFNGIDPLEIDVINLDIPGLENIIRNAKLTGLKDCNVIKLRVNKKESTFEYHLKCKKLKVHGHYKSKGHYRHIYVEGDGDITVTTGPYILILRGNTQILGHDDKIKYYHIKNYHLESNTRDHMKFNFTNLYGGDTKKSNSFHKFMNENTHNELAAAVLNKFMDVLRDHYNHILKNYPMEKIFSSKCIQM